jgi:hypothetical protein
VGRGLRWGIAATMSASVLAGCGMATAPAGPSHPRPVRLAVLPDRQRVSTALPTSIACTTGDSCVVWGTNGSVSGGVDDWGVTAVGFWSDGGRAWHRLRMPDGANADLESYVCASTFCLLLGADPQTATDEVWRYDALSHTVRVVPHPTGGEGIVAGTCADDRSCVVADVAHGRARFLSTGDAGETWRRDAVLDRLGIPRGEVVTALRCWTSTRCLVASSAQHGDGSGTTTVSLTGARGLVGRHRLGQPSIAALSCSSRSSCFLVTSELTYTGYWLQQHLYVSTDGGRRWRYEPSAFGKSMMLVSPASGVDQQTIFGCSSHGCAGIGSERGVWGDLLVSRAKVRDGWRGVATSPKQGFVAVACGRRRCMALTAATSGSVWAVATFRG